MKQEPQDMVVKNLNLGLYPDREGALRIDKLQIPNVRTWTDITATTTYANKNLFLHNLTFDEGHHFQTVNIDLSKASGGKLTLEVKGSVGKGGTIEGNVGLSTTKSSFQTETKVNASRHFVRPVERVFRATGGRAGGRREEFPDGLEGHAG